MLLGIINFEVHDFLNHGHAGHAIGSAKSCGLGEWRKIGFCDSVMEKLVPGPVAFSIACNGPSEIPMHPAETAKMVQENHQAEGKKKNFHILNQDAKKK